MAVVFSDDFNEGQAGFQSNWSVFSSRDWPTLFTGGATANGYWVSCTDGFCYKDYGGTSLQASLRAQCCFKDTGKADAGEPLWLQGPGITQGLLSFILNFKRDGSLGFRMNNVLSGIASSTGLFPTDGSMFGLQFRLIVVSAYVLHLTVTVNNVDVWDVPAYNWSSYDGSGTGGCAYLSRTSIQPHSTGSTLYDGFSIDNFQIDDSASSVAWPAIPNVNINYGCSGQSPATHICRLTQLPVLAAYDYAVLEPFLNDAALAWATPPRES